MYTLFLTNEACPNAHDVFSLGVGHNPCWIRVIAQSVDALNQFIVKKDFS